MRKALLFSNVGPWDSDSIGFLKTIEVEDDPIPTLRSIAKDFVDGEREKQSVELESTALLTKEVIDSTISDWEMNAYCDQEFDVAFATTGAVGIFIALVYI